MEKKEKNPSVITASLVFLLIFGLVFSLGVVVGKKFIPVEQPTVTEQPSTFTDRHTTQKTQDKPSDQEVQQKHSMQTTSVMKEPLVEKPLKNDSIGAMINPEHKYTIQISSFQNKKIASRTVRFLRDKGYPAFITEYSPSEIIAFYRVRIGTFESKEEARAYGKEIQKKERDFKFYVTIND